MITNNAQELGRAIENNQNEIIIEGDLAKKVVRIKATGPVAWVIAFGCVTAAIIAILRMPKAVASGPNGLIAEGVVLGTSAVGAVTILGVPATVAAVSIGVGARNKSALSKLRNNYILTKVKDSKVILRRK